MPQDPGTITLLTHSGLSYGQVTGLWSQFVPRLHGPLPGAVAGANNGGSPPAPTVVAGSFDGRGVLHFGSGTAPAIGAQSVVTFSNVAYAAPPVVLLTPLNAATAALNLKAIPTTTGFTIHSLVAPTASQAGTVYQVNYLVLP
jgi:hypothetical protein